LFNKFSSPEKILLNIDLHNHSNASDGLLTPRALIELAHARRCDIVALTDHDTTAGLAEAEAAAAAVGLGFVRGVEISVTWPHRGDHPDIRPTTVHIVGLNIDPANAALASGLRSVRDGRLDRARLMGADLERAGVAGIFETAWELAENKDMIGRTHFARALVDHGVVKSVGKAFERFLVSGKPGYVPHAWARLQHAVDWITEAGGIAVVAHPGRYRLDPAEMRIFLGDFKAAGGRGLEVVTGSHQSHHFREYAALAREFGFLASRGADFHGAGESPFLPGELPPLPDGVDPVWTAF
jgi:hypothetical protein